MQSKPLPYIRAEKMTANYIFMITVLMGYGYLWYMAGTPLSAISELIEKGVPCTRRFVAIGKYIPGLNRVIRK